MRDRNLKLQVVKDYAALRCNGHVVLDGGAHRGYATNLFLAGGARRVIAVEPHVGNALDWQENVTDKRAFLINAALTVDGEPARLAVSGSPGGMMHSTSVALAGTSYDVPGVTLHGLIENHDASIVKLDVEGAEYDLLVEPLPQRVQQLALEVHLRRRDWRPQAPWLIRHLEAQGFRWSKQPALDTPRWGFVAVGER